MNERAFSQMENDLVQHFRQRVLTCSLDFAQRCREADDIDPAPFTAGLFLELGVSMCADLTTMPREVLLKCCGALFDEAKTRGFNDKVRKRRK